MVEPRRAAIVFIFITVVLDVLAMGMIIPVLPSLLLDMVGRDTARAAQLYGLFGTAWALMQFVFSPVLGVLSDRFGRRPIVLLSNLGLGLDYVLMALAPTVSWLFAGRVLSGITSASISTATAYIADVTPPEKRAASFGMIGAAFGLGFVVGPALGGLLGQYSPRLPFWVAAALSSSNALYGLFVLPESLQPAQRAPFSWRRANPLGALTFFRKYRALVGLGAVSFTSNLAHYVLPSVFVLYAGFRYDWHERAVGLTLAAVGVCAAIVQGALVRPLVARLGERRALLLGLASGSVGFAVYGVASTGAVFLCGVPLLAVCGVAGPSTQGLMSARVEPSEQGQLQGSLGSAMGIAGLIGPGLFSQTFARAIAPDATLHQPGAPFFLASVLMVVAVAVAARVAPHAVAAPAAPAR